MADAAWARVAHTEWYHGKIDATDGRSFWAYKRLHRTFGWCVEVHADAPDGPLVHRRWTVNRRAGSERAGELRRSISRLDGATALAGPWSIDEPTEDVGMIVAHGHRGRSSDDVRIDGNAPTAVCFATWVEAGHHDLRWRYAGRRTVRVRPQQVVHAHGRWLLLFWRPADRMVPPWHLCRLRSLRFDDEGRLSGMRADEIAPSREV